MGSQPMFDNIQYSETCEYRDLMPSDQVRESNLPVIAKSQDEWDVDNFVYGNRTNLLFADTCFEHIAQSGHQGSEIARQVALFENAILGLQVGHLGALDTIIKGRESGHNTYKDRLWATFRSASTQLRLRSQIKSSLSTLDASNEQELD